MAVKKEKTNNPVIEVKNLYKSFNVGKGKVDVLKGIDLKVEAGEFLVIFGPSGCGKSTLLNTIVGLERPTDGLVEIRGKNIYDFKADERATFRRQKFGIVYQQPNWIKFLNVVENVSFPLCVAGKNEGMAIERAKNLLNLFRLEEFERNMPAELSGGQQQRVSVTRALITNPWIIICDEPTGNLDTTAAADLMYVLQYLNSESKRTVIMVTHNPEYEKYATKIVRMEDGKIKSTEVIKKVNLKNAEEESDIIPEEEGAVI